MGRGGRIRNWRHVDWQNMAQRKCARLCHSIGRSEAIFQASNSAPLACTFPLCPRTTLHRDPLAGELAPLQCVSREPPRNKGPQEHPPFTAQWCFRMGAKFSPHQISPFRISFHVALLPWHWFSFNAVSLAVALSISWKRGSVRPLNSEERLKSGCHPLARYSVTSPKKIWFGVPR